MDKRLAGKVAVVTGATRGCGRAIAVELGRLGATVYATGRTTRTSASPMKRAETIEETAELVAAVGGKGIAVRCDFTSAADVDALRTRIESEVDGRLDVLVDDVWGGDPLVDFASAYWDADLDNALHVVHNAIDTHLIALHRLLPLVVTRPGGLVIEVTDGENDDYVGAGIPYYVSKCGVRAISRALGTELANYGSTGLAVKRTRTRAQGHREQSAEIDRPLPEPADQAPTNRGETQPKQRVGADHHRHRGHPDVETRRERGQCGSDQSEADGDEEAAGRQYFGFAGQSGPGTVLCTLRWLLIHHRRVRMMLPPHLSTADPAR
jgi:NAD(P)-dependent dehydrogenase (short-subunit alcohol dehydrogenase family)